MGGLGYLFYPWGIILQVIALIHFARRRPDNYWVWIILIGGGLGALVYIIAEVIPDFGLLRGAFKMFPRRKRINQLRAIIIDNPSPGNYEELGDLLLEDKKFTEARECYNKAITSRTDHVDPFYRRAQCAIELKDFAAAVPDLERVVSADPKYDFKRGEALLAHAYAKTGQPEKAEALFKDATSTSTISETYLNYADLLTSLGRHAEAREWAQKVLAKKPTMPGYLKRRERPWFRQAAAMLKRIPA